MSDSFIFASNVSSTELASLFLSLWKKDTAVTLVEKQYWVHTQQAACCKRWVGKAIIGQDFFFTDILVKKPFKVPLGMDLLAPQSDALRRGAFRDFHPINPIEFAKRF